jgi:hypothetical protein
LRRRERKDKKGKNDVRSRRNSEDNQAKKKEGKRITSESGGGIQGWNEAKRKKRKRTRRHKAAVGLESENKLKLRRKKATPQWRSASNTKQRKRNTKRAIQFKAAKIENEKVEKKTPNKEMGQPVDTAATEQQCIEDLTPKKKKKTKKRRGEEDKKKKKRRSRRRRRRRRKKKRERKKKHKAKLTSNSTPCKWSRV